MNAPLELTGLTKMFETPVGPVRRGRRTSTPQIDDGEFVCILGHSGCGKSTVLSIIAGLRARDLRRRRHRRQRSRRARAGSRGGVSVAVPAAVADRPATTCSWPSRARRTARQSREASTRGGTLDLVGVGDAADQLPAELSLGTQQCVSLARALSLEPRFLLLDEPFSTLDSLTRFELQDTLLEVWEQRAARSWSW